MLFHNPIYNGQTHSQSFIHILGGEVRIKYSIHYFRGYSFSIPLRVLNRATFKALTGRSYATKIVEGRIAADMPDGSITSAGGGQSFRVRFIAFKSDTLQLVFDLNPYGTTQMYTDYPFSGEPMATAAVPIMAWWSLPMERARTLRSMSPAAIALPLDAV